jgi:hypothetical protein
MGLDCLGAGRSCSSTYRVEKWQITPDNWWICRDICGGKKTKVMHFSHSKLRTAPAVRHGDVEKHPESALRWLGLWLDSRLSFRIHVEKCAAKAKAVAYHLRGLSNTKHGPLPSTMRSAVRACVEPVFRGVVPGHNQAAMEPACQRPTSEQPTRTENEQGFEPVHESYSSRLEDDTYHRPPSGLGRVGHRQSTSSSKHGDSGSQHDSSRLMIPILS